MIDLDVLDDWNKVNFLNAINDSFINESINWSLDGSEYGAFISHLNSLRLSRDFDVIENSTINGNLSMGWKDLNKDNIFFQDALDATIELAASTKTSWNPVDYLLMCYLQAKNKGVHISEMDLGRALRNLPSFLREYLIAGALNSRGISTQLPSPEINATNHVDIIVNIDGVDISVWSYLSTDKALDYLNTKLTGRGRISRGINLLAPFANNDKTNYLNWYVPSQDYISRLIDSFTMAPISYERALKMKKNDFIVFSY